MRSRICCATMLWILTPALVLNAVAGSEPTSSKPSVAYSNVSTSLGRCEGDPLFDARADLNGDGCVNVLDLGRLRAKEEYRRFPAAGAAELMVIDPPSTAALSGETVSLLAMILQNSTPLLGYSLDVDVIPAAGAVGSVTADVAATNFYEVQNLITAGGAELDPLFSAILDLGDGGVFINAITADDSTVLAVADINDALGEILFDVSGDACGDFAVQFGPASALSDADAFAVPFDVEPAVIRVRAAACPEDLDCNGEVRVPDLIALLAAWGPSPGHPADLDGNGEVRVPDLIAMLGVWGGCP